MTNENRLDYIDIYKGIGVILMVMGHIEFGKTFDHFIHAFHMPMFFFISGYLYKHKTKDELSFVSFMINKARALLIPYVAFGIFHFCFSFLF